MMKLHRPAPYFANALLAEVIVLKLYQIERRSEERSFVSIQIFHYTNPQALSFYYLAGNPLIK